MCFMFQSLSKKIDLKAVSLVDLGEKDVNKFGQNLFGFVAPSAQVRGQLKSTQRTNFQSISYFAYSFMKLTLIYVKVFFFFRYGITLFLMCQQAALKNCCQEKCQQE